MKRLATTTLLMATPVFVIGLTGVLPGLLSTAGFERTVQAAGEKVMTFDVACDCRMGSPAFFGGNRGEAWIVSGKIFPVGTLTGAAGNDPTQPVRGIAPIGEWTCRGQNALPFPAAVGAAYDASPPGFNTQYFAFNNNNNALTVEGYPRAAFNGERLAVTGGIGSFAGAAGDLDEGPIGTNATGCPNFRATFKIQPGSLRNGSND